MESQKFAIELANCDKIRCEMIQMIKIKIPTASYEKQLAFANSVAYLVTGWLSPGGSIREKAVQKKYEIKEYGKFSTEKAVELLLNEKGLIFGPLTDLHRQCWKETSEDEDPQDIAELRKIKSEELPISRADLIACHGWPKEE